MSATPASTTDASVSRTSDLSGSAISARGLLRSEWTKLWSVRSLWLTLAAAFALTVGLCGYMIIDGAMLGSDEAKDIPFGWTAIYPVGMLGLVIFGVLINTSEYSSGTIRTSMIAAPRRTGVLAAKAVVSASIVAVLATVTSMVLYALLQLTGTVDSAKGMSPLDPDMFWGMLCGTLILPFGTLFGVALGGLVRNAAAAITLYFAVFQMGPQILPNLLPEGIARVTDYMPLAAVDVFRAGGLSSDPYNIGVAIVVLLAWLAGLGGAAWWLLKRRDV